MAGFLDRLFGVKSGPPPAPAWAVAAADEAGWWTITPWRELPDGRPLRLELGDVPVVVVRRGETVHAVDAVCPHAGGPMEEGKVDGEHLVCPYHQWRFSLKDGVCHGRVGFPLAVGTVSLRGEAAWVRPPDLAGSAAIR